MDLGNLTIMCINLICVTSAGVLVLWALVHIQGRGRRRPRIYNEPHFPDKRSLLDKWRRDEEHS